MSVRKHQSVISLDPIERNRKRQDSVFGRLLKTRPHGGAPVIKTAEIGHYLFCGKQRSGKTVSMLWYAEQLIRKWEVKGKEVKLYSNMDIGEPVTKMSLFEIMRLIDYDPKVIHIFMVDEIQSYFPKDTKDKFTLALVDQLTGTLSQIGKRQIYLLSTAQVYGRLHKSLREQCLYMVHCRRSKISRKVVNDFIDGDDIMCDDLGRWSGIPKVIHTHGLPKMKFDTHRMITE